MLKYCFGEGAYCSLMPLHGLYGALYVVVLHGEDYMCCTVFSIPYMMYSTKSVDSLMYSGTPFK